MWSEAKLSVSSSVLEGGEKGSLPVVATVFDKLNQVYKEYLEAEQSYTVVSDVSSASFLFSSVRFHVFWVMFVFVVRRRWSPVRVEAARLRSVRSELRRSSTNQTCTHTSCRRSQRGRYTNTHMTRLVQISQQLWGSEVNTTFTSNSQFHCDRKLFFSTSRVIHVRTSQNK